MSQAQGEIYDLGYQHYDGPRGGRLQAVWSLWVNGFRTTLGLGRGARAKVLPALMALVAVAPTAVFLVLAAIVPLGPPDGGVHASFYRATALLLLLFAAIIAPELLIPDRRSGVFTLYLVRPLTAFDYVAARWAAFLCVILAVTLCGQVLVLGANLLLAEAPMTFLRENWQDIPRFILGGVIVALFVTTIPMAVAAFTERRAYAAAFVIAVFVITTPMASVLAAEWCETTVTENGSGGEVEIVVGESASEGGPREQAAQSRQETQQDATQEERVRQDESGAQQEPPVAEECRRITGDYAKWFALLDVGRAPTHLIDLLFSVQPEEDQTAVAIGELPRAVPIAWYALLVLAPGAILLLRYRRMSI